MAKAKKEAETEKSETPPDPWERASVEITKTPAERIHREVTYPQFKKLAAEHGAAKVQVLEVLK